MADKVSLQCIRGVAPGIFQIGQNDNFVYLVHKQVLVSNKQPSMEEDVLCKGQLNLAFMVCSTRLYKHSLFLLLIGGSHTSFYSTVIHNAIISLNSCHLERSLS